MSIATRPSRVPCGCSTGVEHSAESAIDAVLDRLADAIDPDVLGAEIGDLIVDHVKEFAEREDDDLRRITQIVASRTLRDAWHGVRMSGGREDFDPPVAAVGWAAELVHRGVELHALLRAYRIAHDRVEREWEAAAGLLEPDGELRARSLYRASRYFFAYVDAVSVQLTRIYLDERARWVCGSAATRAEMVRTLLSGEKVPAAKATSALRYEVAATHTGFVVWMEPSEPDGERAAALGAVAEDIGKTLGDGASMLVPVGNWLVWGWAHHAARPQHAPALPAGVRVAIGSPAAGIEGLVRTHQEAIEARRVARLRGGRACGVVTHHEVALLSLLTANPIAATRFVEAELGALAGEDESMARLRTTLRVYFEEHLNPIRASRRLCVNKNTIVYRVAKAEEILGHEVRARRRELEAALHLSDVYG